MYKIIATGFASITLLINGNAFAGVIISPESATATSVEMPDISVIENAIDQSGLSTGFTSGVTDFDTYIDSNPTHNHSNANSYWGATFDTPTMTFDLGNEFTIDALALWNHGLLGIRNANIYGSTDGIDFILIATITPSNQGNVAQIFSFAATALRYIQFDIMRCGSQFDTCRVGEVAFRVADVSEAPIPAALPLLLSGLAGLGFAARRRKIR